MTATIPFTGRHLTMCRSEEEDRMPIDYADYPENWPELRAAVLERAGHRCEACGVANYAVGARDLQGRWHHQLEIDTMNSTEGDMLFGEYPNIIRIVLTVHHTCRDKACDDLAHLQALCQRCHLNADREHHQRKATETRRRKQLEQNGQRELAL